MNTGTKSRTQHTTGICVGISYLNFDPLPCAASTLFTQSSPQTWIDLFLFVLHYLCVYGEVGASHALVCVWRSIVSHLLRGDFCWAPSHSRCLSSGAGI